MDEAANDKLRDDVARRVMGWTAHEIPWAYTQRAVCWHDAEGVAVLARDAWRPDEDERQCARVLERMLALGFDLSLEVAGGEARACFARAGAGRAPAVHASRRVALLRAALDAAEDGEEASGVPGGA